MMAPLQFLWVMGPSVPLGSLSTPLTWIWSMSSGPSVARWEASQVALVSPMHSIEVMQKTMSMGRIAGA